jgi:glycosyltransferase involved in cell wall biosynthesis
VVARATAAPHVINWHRQPGFEMTVRQRAAVRFAASVGSGVIAVTGAQVPELRNLGFSPSAIRVVPNGTNPPSGSLPDRSEARSSLGLPEDAYLVVLVARLRPEKRHSDFISAVAALRSEVPSILGVIVGDGPEEKLLRRQAENLRAPVRFAGFQADPMPYMIASDVVCLPSEFEALPISLIEAASCGRPAIATSVGGTGEIVLHDETGLLIPPRNVDALRDSLRILYGSPGRRQAMGDRALRHWQDRFSFDAMVGAYFDLLTTVAGPPTSWDPRS